LSNVYRLFRNPFYAGLIKWNGKISPGKHPAMVTLDEFDRVQRLLTREGQPRPQLKEAAYTGLIRCGECGRSVTIEEQINRFGSHYTYYRCTKKRLDYPCRQPYVSLKELERQIDQFLTEITIADTLCRWGLARLERVKATRDKVTDSARAALKHAEDVAGRELGNLLTLRLRELIGDEEFKSQRLRLEAEQLRIKERIGNAADANFWLEPAKAFISLSSRAVVWFREGDIQTKRLILESVGSNLRLKDKKLSIDARKPFRRWPKNASHTHLWRILQDVRTLSTTENFTHLIAACKRLSELTATSESEKRLAA
jgi:site-specific DNA recombinase